MATGLHDSPAASHVVLSFPRADLLFRRLAVEAVDAQRTPGQPTWTDLRLRYPNAELHHQRSVVIDRKSVDTWFAFRDGRGQPSCPPDPWWSAPGAASATLSATGRVTNRSRSFQLLFGGRVGTTVHAATDLLSATLVEAVTTGPASLWRAPVASTGLFQTSSGEANLEFRIDWDDDGPDRHRFAARTFDERATSHYDLALRDSSLGVLPPVRRVESLRGSRVKDLARGERLQDSVFGAPWSALVLCGIARVYVARDSVEPTVAHAGAGTLLGSHIGPDGSALVIGLQAMTPCRVLQLDPARVARMLKSDIAFAAAVAADARETLAGLIETYAARSAAGLGPRLARDLLAIDDLHGEDGFIPMTEQQLADGLGSIRESVARTVGDFRRRGWIATTRYGVIVRDREAVEAYAAVG